MLKKEKYSWSGSYVVSHSCSGCKKLFHKKYLRMLFVMSKHCLTGFLSRVRKTSPPVAKEMSWSLPPGKWEKRKVRVNRRHVWRGRTWEGGKWRESKSEPFLVLIRLVNPCSTKLAEYPAVEMSQLTSN